MPHLTPQQIRTYHEQGFVIVEKLLDDATVARIGERLRLAALGKLDPGIRIGRERNLTEQPTPDTDPLLTVRKVSELARHDEGFRAIADDDRLVGAARDLIGDNIRYFGDEAQLKPAHFGSPHPWHQDEPYFKDMAVPVVTIWIAVDRATEANGCMQVIPGSHLKGVVERKTHRFFLADDEVDTSGAVHAELEPGGALLFHSRLLHGSGPNRTDKSRRSMICRYCDVSNLTDVQRSAFPEFGVVLDDPKAPAIFQPLTASITRGGVTR